MNTKILHRFKEQLNIFIEGQCIKTIRWEFHLGFKQSLSSRLLETTSQGSTTTPPPPVAPPGTCHYQTCCLLWLGHFYALRETVTQWSQQSPAACINEKHRVHMDLTQEASAISPTEANRIKSSLLFRSFWTGHKDVLTHKLVFQLQLKIIYIKW